MNFTRIPPDANARRTDVGGTPADLLIIGGGVLGLSTGCEVLARGLSVTILDEDPQRSATWASAGMLSPYAEHAEAGALQDMLRAARVAWPAFAARIEEHSGMRVDLAFPGTVMPAFTAGERSRLEELTQRLRDLGARCSYLSPQEAIGEEPMLTANASGAVLLDDEGYVNPRLLHTALRSAFERLGGQWVPVQALGLAARQGRVVGVETTIGFLPGHAVVNAAGAWGERFLLPEDQRRYRTKPIRGQTVRLRPPSRREGVRHVIQAPGSGYLVPQADGTVVVGATSEDAGPFRVNTAGGIRYLLDLAGRLVASSADWSFVEVSNGLRPLAGDFELVLESDSSRKGLFHGLGLYRHGILLAPVASTRMCRLVCEYLGQHSQ